ncbi:MAG: galactose-1-phosphate uridylyltransferase [Acidimicrobiales bacterium]
MASPATHQLRRNPLTGRWVTIVAARASRPQDFLTRVLEVEQVGDRPCPFCPGNEEATPPALETYGPDGGWLVRVVPNLYPAFVGTQPMQIEHVTPLHVQAPASGLHEVLVFAPEHDLRLDQLDSRRITLVMAALRDRFEDHSHHPEIAYTQAIVNYGREAGASLEHPHAQLLGIPFVPGEIDDEYRGIDEHPSSCLLCDTTRVELAEGERIVLADEHAVVIAPWWSGAPYEMLILPRTHAARAPDADPFDVTGVGRALRDALRRLRHVLGDVAYNIMVHTAPHQARGTYHWHVHLLPRTSTAAGFEQGTGVLINTVSPENAAAQLRHPEAVASAGR